MSSRPPAEFLTLPPELIEDVAKRISDRRSLSSMRMTCKALDQPASKELFKSVYISPAGEDVSTWNSISEHNVIRHIPRHVLIRTHSEEEDDRSSWNGDIEREETGSDLENAIAALSKFPNLESLQISFTEECKGRAKESWEDDPAESASQREDMLRLVFQAIKARAVDKENRTIRNLTLENLQNCPVPEFTSSELFRDVMGQLDELHVSLTQEYNEHGPDHDYTKVELRTFPAHFCADWLKPISSKLKALSIYHHNENWGPFPGYFDPSGIEFPKLETLALGYYTLAHDADLDWIVAIKSLRRLVLHNCMIASYVRISSANMAEWKMPTQDWIAMPSEYDDSEFKYDGTWSSYLDRIADGLPSLVDFRFDQGGLYHDKPYSVVRRGDCDVRIFPKRYVVFDNGILPTHWPEAESDGELYTWLEDEDGFPNLHETHLEEDQESLDRLLEKTRSRR
ncbi:uncharacterized protein M421DRAFT_426609 [Didymella exigua CBS 183.55]|uniref:F-box domain-containing protein n=1 Tax=Didymella exigua CBS 183.55 TaxID=1150837 RepID=A0A6A5R4R2_9PLEO|nr:uncharacterized protein M421DRAFT_426609 [Didymella exigua CBS 183.55]KAF1922682.1 hypothetical protein M421DRAFT_426609 [Didymella exigua CBS 183.55]